MLLQCGSGTLHDLLYDRSYHGMLCSIHQSFNARVGGSIGVSSSAFAYKGPEGSNMPGSALNFSALNLSALNHDALSAA